VGTVYTTDEEEAMHDLDDILCNYPQVVNFTGHTHSPANDPRSVRQGDFTVLNCGSMIYYGDGIAGLCDKYVYPTDHNGGCSILVPGNQTLDDAGDYYIVELDCRNAIKITGYSIYSDEAACTYYLRSVGDPSKFRYNENRVEMTQIPSFAVGDELTVASLSPSTIKISVPQTSSVVYTQHYRLVLYDRVSMSSLTERRCNIGIYRF